MRDQILRIRENLTQIGLAFDLYEDPAVSATDRAYARQALRHALADANETLYWLERESVAAKGGYVGKVAS